MPLFVEGTMSSAIAANILFPLTVREVTLLESKEVAVQVVPLFVVRYTLPVP